MRRTVLVTGATGFIGRIAVAALEFEGWQVVRGCRSVPNGYGEEPGVSSCVSLDLEDPGSILRLKNSERADVILHLAARVGWTGESDSDLFVPNVLATGNLLAVARHWGARFVFASAAIVCGARAETIGPMSPACPDTTYGRSKWLGEQMVAASCQDYCILRLGGVFGASGPSHLGINRAIDAAMEGTVPTLIGAGKARRNYLYVKDAANAIVAALGQGVQGTHLVAGSEAVTIREMWASLCAIFLSGAIPATGSGSDAREQVIEPSPTLPVTRTFVDALLDIRNNRAT